jgi:hypothetical protein
MLAATATAVGAIPIGCIFNQRVDSWRWVGLRSYQPATGTRLRHRPAQVWTAGPRGSARLAGHREGGFACTVADSRSTCAPGPFELT